ncbi:hypothetical protein NM688_g5594 [Phlebia brevispora]|uniref:Uncharacterized protein n=1 Tax=Phlebia brevispora TaxID=194682 RepID=A0ACC1SSX9_9APHY|nr:hypothetical protein NM688_g5594 [Phlebia brevispora]
MGTWRLPEDAISPILRVLEPTVDTESRFDFTDVPPINFHNDHRQPLNVSLVARIKDGLVEQVVDIADRPKLCVKHVVWASPLSKAVLTKRVLAGKLYDYAIDTHSRNDIRIAMTSALSRGRTSS